jgi:PAS domain S-box-containing protein
MRYIRHHSHYPRAAPRRFEFRLRGAVRPRPVPAYIFDDATWEFLAVNNAAAERYGYSREEFLRLSLADTRPPEDRTALQQVSRACVHEPKYEAVWRHKTRAGEIFDVQVVSQRITYHGRAAHFVVATEQEALFHSRRRLQALFDYARDAMPSGERCRRVRRRQSSRLRAARLHPRSDSPDAHLGDGLGRNRGRGAGDLADVSQSRYTLGRIPATRRDMPVVVVTPDATPRLTRRLQAAGATAFLTRPLDIKGVLDLIDGVLGDRTKI